MIAELFIRIRWFFLRRLGCRTFEVARDSDQSWGIAWARRHDYRVWLNTGDTFCCADLSYRGVRKLINWREVTP